LYLDEPIEREPTDDGIDTEFGHGKQSEHNPVGQPLGVVILICTFDGFDAANKNTIVSITICTILLCVIITVNY